MLIEINQGKKIKSSMTPTEGGLLRKGQIMEDLIRVLTLIGLVLQIVAVVLDLLK